jgi:hypothetical protein
MRLNPDPTKMLVPDVGNMFCPNDGSRMQPQSRPSHEIKVYRVCPQCGEDYAETFAANEHIDREAQMPWFNDSEGWDSFDGEEARW